MRWLGCCAGFLALGMVFGQEANPNRKTQDQAKLEVVRIDLRNLDLVLATYHRKNGKYPTNLWSLAQGNLPYLEREPLDPWGKPYLYDPTGMQNRGKKPDVWTVTPDKRTVGNWPEAAKGAEKKVPGR